MPAGFASALKEHAKKLSRLQDTNTGEILEVLEKVKEQLIGRLYSAANADAQVDAFLYRRVIQETEAAIEQFRHGAHAKMDGVFSRTIGVSINDIETDINRLSKVFEGESIGLQIDAASVAADPTQKLLLEGFDTSLKRYGLDIVSDIRRDFLNGLRSGTPYGDTLNLVAAKTGPFGEVGKAKAERIMRTETSAIYGAAQHRSLKEAHKEAPELKKCWIHLSSWKNKGKACEVCSKLHGSERLVGEGSGDNKADYAWQIKTSSGPRWITQAPAHPNCCCRVTGMKPSWKEKLQDLGYLDADKNEEKPQAL